MLIRIYTTPTCQYCKMAKNFFDKHGLEYREVDVSKDEDAREEMVEKSHQMGVPVIEVGEHVFVGFHRSEIVKVLNLDS